MKTKTGFTLAEVLIALTIIGIIAAITVPHLTKNLQKRQTEVTLARATQQIETGIQEYFQYKSKTNNKYKIHYSKFSDINDNIKIAEFSSFLGLTKSDVDTVNYREYAFTPITLLPSAYAANEAVGPICTNIMTGQICHYSDKYTDPFCTCTQGGIGEDTPENVHYKDKEGGGGEGTTEPYKPANKKDEEPSVTLPGAGKDYTDNTHPGVIVTPPDNNQAKPSTYSHKGLRYSMTFDDNKLDFSETEDNSIVIGFLIDTNGYKNNPNMYGKDVFRYGITNSGKLVPEGQSEQTCADGNITNGLSCTARIVKDGYKIRYY